MDFQLTSDFQPTGDQPKAIAELVKNMNEGEPASVLLGVTGSGKSLGYSDPVYIVVETQHQRNSQVRPIGPLIDEAFGQNEGVRLGELEMKRGAIGRAGTP